MIFLVLGQFVNSIAGSTGYFMNMTGDHMVFQHVMLAAAFLNLIANLLLVPLLGMVGAALSAMGTLVFWNLYLVFFIKKKYGRTIGYIPAFKLASPLF
jgi:O-antigen/teichoic acid export membrane protein